MDGKAERICIVALVILALLSLALSYYLGGPLWDYIVHYLNARSFLSPAFLSRNFTIIQGQVIEKGTVYVELLRPPLPSALFALLIPFFSNPLFAYLVLVFALFAFSIWYLARSAGFDKVLLFSLMLNPYFIYMSFTIGSEEALSIAFLLMALAMLYRKRAVSGIFLALACMGKYPTLAFLPILLLLGRRERIAAAYALFLLATLPWLLFNYYFFGNPLASYEASVGLNITSGAEISIYLLPPLMAIAIPAAVLAAGLLKARIGRIRETVVSAFRKSAFTNIAFVSAALSIVSFIFASLHASFFDQIRYSYLVCLSAVLLAAVVLQHESARVKHLQRDIWIISIALLAVSAAIFYYYYPKPNYNDIYYQNSSVSGALAELSALGYQNCSVMTNAWPYLLFENAEAYSPWVLNATTSQEYPIVYFKDVGIAASFLWNINSSTLGYNGSRFQVYLPRHVSCVK